MKLLGFLEEEAVVLDMKARSKEDAIRELLQVTIEHGGLPASHLETVYKQVMEREKRGSTGLGDGIAIPHVKDCKDIQGLTGAFGRCKTGIKFDAVDGNPVNLVFLILGGEGTGGDHVKILRTLASLRQNEHFLRFLRNAKDKPAVADVIKEMAGSLA
ncbi:MAG: PTS sugar transporter subunit IIA [Planctomycetes bacterium]|nr:PTS sugar transporter subunit IIA [Planctomycetota bacterium]MCW8140705.1 PTS sugar transporter subunit IIA [Planctomycetota bacterium]